MSRDHTYQLGALMDSWLWEETTTLWVAFQCCLGHKSNPSSLWWGLSHTRTTPKMVSLQWVTDFDDERLIDSAKSPSLRPCSPTTMPSFALRQAQRCPEAGPGGERDRFRRSYLQLWWRGQELLFFGKSLPQLVLLSYCQSSIMGSLYLEVPHQEVSSRSDEINVKLKSLRFTFQHLPTIIFVRGNTILFWVSGTCSSVSLTSSQIQSVSCSLI